MTRTAIRRWQSFALVMVATLFTMSCGGPTDIGGDEVLVRATPPVLRITNQGLAPVYFIVMEGEFAARANWAPCTDPALCQHIARGGNVELALVDIAGYHGDAAMVIVYWWHLIPGGPTGFQPDSIRVTGASLVTRRLPGA